MSFAFVGGGGGAALPSVNPDDTYEPLGYAADGSLTVVTSGASTHTKGAYVTIGTTVAAFAGFWLDIGQLGTVTSRAVIDIRAGGATIIVGDLPIVPGNGPLRLWIPLNVAAGTLLEARIQASTASTAIHLAITGRIDTAATPAMFSTCTALLTADLTTTRGNSAAAMAGQASLATWTQLVGATASEYGALLVSWTAHSVAPTGGGHAQGIIGKGAAAAETVIQRMPMRVNLTDPYIAGTTFLIEQKIPVGSRLAGAFVIGAAGIDTVRATVHGFA